MDRAVCRGVVGLLVSVLGDVLFELGFWWKEEGRLLCGVVIVFGSLLNL